MHIPVHFVLGSDGSVRFPAMLAKSVAAEIASAKKPPLPDYVQKQIDDAYRRRRLARMRAARKDISNIQAQPRQSKAVKAAASSIRRSLAKSVAAGRSVLR